MTSKADGLGVPRFAELLVAADRPALRIDEVEVRLRNGIAIRFRGGCPADLIERVIAMLERAAC